MSEYLAPDFWIDGLQIVTVNLLLSGDNAVVIALACRNLPDRQRKIAVFWGVFGAVAARVVLTVFAASLLALPYVKLAGAALLIWIGIQLIAQEEDVEHKVEASERLLAAVWTVVVADVVMSLDNVIAVAAAAHGHLGLLVFGLVLSIPIVVLGSGLFMKLVEKFPLLIVAGGGLLGYIAGDMASTDPEIARIAPYAGFATVVAAGLALAAYRRRGRETAP